MFTGIVTDIGEIISITPRGDLRRLRIACAYEAEGIALGASIACSGTCLTVVAVAQENGRTIFDVDAAAETLRLTTVGTWRVGTRINLERHALGLIGAGDALNLEVDMMARYAARLSEASVAAQ